MNDVIVSIRMPESLIKELKALAREQHFLDLSEQVRSIVRNKWLMSSDPRLFELKSLRLGIEEEVRKKSIEKVQEQVNKELEKIKDNLKKGELFWQKAL